MIFNVRRSQYFISLKNSHSLVRNLEAIGAVGANLRPFSFGGSVGPLRWSPQPWLTLYMERKTFTVQPIKRP